MAFENRVHEAMVCQHLLRLFEGRPTVYPENPLPGHLTKAKVKEFLANPIYRQMYPKLNFEELIYQTLEQRKGEHDDEF